MQRLLYTLWNTGLRLRCPVCRVGPLFASPFTLHRTCPRCGARFERDQGEVTGAMTVSILVVAVIFLIVYPLTELWFDWPLWVHFAIWLPYALLFPILFYRNSRALWVAVLFLTNDIYPDQEPHEESTLSITDAFLYNPSEEKEQQPEPPTPPG